MIIGDKLPEFSLPGADGKIHTQFSFADKYAVVFIFTCNSNDISKAYTQRLIKLLKKYEDDNLGIVGINSNNSELSPEDSLENMKIVSDKLHLKDINFLYLKDEKKELAQRFGASVNPEAFVFNSKRELVYKGAIDDCWENEAMVTRVWLEDAVEYALDGIEVDYPEIQPTGFPII